MTWARSSRNAAEPGDGDIVVLSQKVVSKAEGRLRRLDDVRARRAGRASWPPRSARIRALFELILDESRAVIRAAPGVLITETHAGWICANAGIDASNLDEGSVALLPADADASARRIRAEIRAASGAAPAVVIADSFGRPWRLGQADVAIGCAGIVPLDDWRGPPDAGGRELAATVVAVADQLAAAADLARDKDSGVPGAVVSGLARSLWPMTGRGRRPLRRPADEDLFR